MRIVDGDLLHMFCQIRQIAGGGGGGGISFILRNVHY